MTGVVHIAGNDLRVGAQLRQRCAWCGAVLIDHDLSTLMVPAGQEDRAPATWPVGGLVELDGPLSVAIAHNDGDRLPTNACAQLDHELTGTRQAGR